MEKNKWNAALTTCVICVILFAFTIADFLGEDRFFSETENRVLASKPELTMEAVLTGNYMEDYDTYVTDQFVGRDKWISVKTRTDILLQRQEINGVYLGRDGYLIEKHGESDYPEEQLEKKLDLLKQLVDRWDAKVMLVPTADNVLTEKLPAYADVFDQKNFLALVPDRIGQEHMVPVYDTLTEHRGEEIYYRTDHHWTSLGAYYGYLAWASAAGELPASYNPDTMKVVSDDFLGTLHSKINLSMPADEILIFPETDRPVQIVYDLQKKTDSFYEESYLHGKNQYGYFLDDNHAFLEIDTGNENGRTLFVLKDSYANCMIPLLAAHYEKIYVTDLRYMNGKLFPFMESYEPETGMDVLVLYNCIHFIEEFRYW